MSLKHSACLLRGTHQQLAAFLPVSPISLPQCPFLEQDTLPGLRRPGGQGMMPLVGSDGEEPPSPSCLLPASEMLHSPLPCSGCKPGGDTPDVFISYRRNSGSQLAR